MSMSKLSLFYALISAENKGIQLGNTTMEYHKNLGIVLIFFICYVILLTSGP